MIISHILLLSLVRWIDLAAMILLVGGMVFKRLVVSSLGGENSLLERCLPFFLLLTGLTDLVLRSQMISGQPLAGAWAFLPTVLLKSHFGKVWMARTLLLCLLGATSVLKPPKTEGLALTACALLLLTASLSGHAADSGDFSLTVLIDWLHLGAVSAWTGGLFFLAFLLRRWVVSTAPDSTSGAFSVSVRRFSALAGLSVIVALATGGYQAWHRVGSLSALGQTGYGRVLVVKLILVLPLLGLGAINRCLVLPKLSQDSVEPFRGVLKRLLNIVTLETALGLGIIACVALLIQLPPARSQQASAFRVLSHSMSHLSQGEKQPPRFLPAEGAKVTILTPKEGQTFGGDQIAVRFKLIKGKRGEHAHAYVDGELMGMFKSEEGTLTGLRPGHHTLELRVVAEDHQTELDATDRVQFMVK